MTSQQQANRWQQHYYDNVKFHYERNLETVQVLRLRLTHTLLLVYDGRERSLLLCAKFGNAMGRCDGAMQRNDAME